MPRRVEAFGRVGFAGADREQGGGAGAGAGADFVGGAAVVVERGAGFMEEDGASAKGVVLKLMVGEISGGADLRVGYHVCLE